jgi:hypothetical protein
VGDPPGDVTADLTARPVRAASGRATFLVDGRAVTLSAGSGGVFAVAVAHGATVEVKPGSVRDQFGNANGNALTLTP